MFITFEGSEGSGKSSQIKLIEEWLTDGNRAVYTTREPGGTHIGDQIRSCLHDIHNTNMNSTAELLLYSASRAQLVSEVIKPALQSGAIVLSDRFTDSSMAYQGYGRGLDLMTIHRLNDLSTDGLKPDLTILLDIDVWLGLERKKGMQLNRLDLESIEFHERVSDGYHILSKPKRWVVVDASLPFWTVQKKLREIIEEQLLERK